ncbi:MupG family TIM beta-alpha barrel fold protein [Lactobacillus sp. ESL0677]|uniref:DUF871 domain-containing protein n=1 Tax=Lactobacillus sp. ESL0677 TaxID=2983208 RepID=UPI0023FA005C|nr:MupG family TIM beta-alpha barrel fold protein [Lactobacillus sp. ESL0677]WEV37402.1 MupG family TIM beta-alpha barrel fold protein [Lactobacillus sp. ESL0677]
MTMRHIGLSIYPDHSDEKQDEQYLLLGEKYGFTRIFMSMLEAKNVAATKKKFQHIIQFGNKHGFATTLDVSPSIFKQLGISYTDLSFFKELGATAIRLDEGFDGRTEAELTFNPEHMIIELNMSNNTGYLDNVLSYQANEPFIYGCHNFYPQVGCGLEDNFFEECSKNFKKHGIHTAAFVSSQCGTHGPWDVNDGLPTREADRHLPIEVQAKSLFMTNLIDDVIIGNSYASEDELRRLSELDRYELSFDVEMLPGISPLEQKILLEDKHFRRGDSNALVARSTMPRVWHRAEANPAHDNQIQFEVGDILIGNDGFGIYKNELQVVLQPHSDERKNKIAAIKPEELPLLKYLRPWTKFKFESHQN